MTLVFSMVFKKIVMCQNKFIIIFKTHMIVCQIEDKISSFRNQLSSSKSESAIFSYQNAKLNEQKHSYTKKKQPFINETLEKSQQSRLKQNIQRKGIVKIEKNQILSQHKQCNSYENAQQIKILLNGKQINYQHIEKEKIKSLFQNNSVFGFQFLFKELQQFIISLTDNNNYQKIYESSKLFLSNIREPLKNIHEFYKDLFSENQDWGYSSNHQQRTHLQQKTDWDFTQASPKTFIKHKLILNQQFQDLIQSSELKHKKVLQINDTFDLHETKVEQSWKKMNNSLSPRSLLVPRQMRQKFKLGLQRAKILGKLNNRCKDEKVQK